MCIELCIFIAPFLCFPLAPIFQAIGSTPAMKIPLGLLETRFNFGANPHRRWWLKTCLPNVLPWWCTTFRWRTPRWSDPSWWVLHLVAPTPAPLILADPPAPSLFDHCSLPKNWRRLLPLMEPLAWAHQPPLQVAVPFTSVVSAAVAQPVWLLRACPYCRWGSLSTSPLQCWPFPLLAIPPRLCSYPGSPEQVLPTLALQSGSLPP